MLDDKLREILNRPLEHESWGGDPEYLQGMFTDRTIAQIKKCFAEAGYKKPSTAARQIQEMSKMLEADGVMSNYRTVKTMTGQEWFSRFEKELRSLDRAKEYAEESQRHFEGRTAGLGDALEAARRASGLEDKS